MSLKLILFATFLICTVNSLPTRAQNKEIDSLKLVLSKMPDDTNKVNTLRLLFISSIDKLPANKALLIVFEQLALAKKIHFQKGEAKAYQLISVGYESEGNLPKALDASLNALKIFEKLNDQIGIGASYSNIGLVYKDENALNEALAYFKKSLEIYDKLNRPENIWRGEMNMGRTYEQLNKDSLALASYVQSLETCESLKGHQDLFRANSLFHIGSIYFDRRQYSISKGWLLKALNFGSRVPPDEFPNLSEIYVVLSKIYIAENQFNKGLEAALKGLELVKKVNYKSQQAENYLQIAKAYGALKNFNSAYNYQEKYIKLKDSIVNVANIGAIAKLQNNYKLEKQEQVNRNLLRDKKLAESLILLQKITIQRQYAVGGVIGLALLSFILLSAFYYTNFRIKKRDNELLNLQQQEILQQNHEITAQNEEILSQKENLAELNIAKNKLFSIISHDLRSPVSTLQQALAMFNNELLTNAEVENLSSELLQHVTATSTMLDNVLYWAKSQMEGIHLKKQLFDIKEIADANFLNFKNQAKDKKIDLVSRIDNTMNVFADKDTIDIVVRNLVSNAIKFCNPNDIITVSAYVKERFLYFSVADTGKGISTEVQKKLFSSEEFYSTFGTANEKGTGLGLNLCRDFVTMNGGTIWVESEPGLGSTFTFTVPLS